MELVSDYMREDTMRHALNELTRKTFFFDFEDWVTGGYFEGDYIPYSGWKNNCKCIRKSDDFSSEWCREKLHTDRNGHDR